MPDKPAVWSGDDVPADAGPCVVVIGVFDAVHRGHQLVVGAAAARAGALGVPCVVVTFDPDPAEVVGRGEPPPRLTSVGHRAELLGRAGADAVWVLPFTTELSRLGPDEFVDQVLVARLHPVAVVVGSDFRFGHRAAGDVAVLTELGARSGFEVDPVAVTGRGDASWSSTAVRTLVADGEVERAAAALGRPYRVEGVVVHGDHRGRDLGFPTANLALDPRAAVPGDGVYAGVLERAGGAGRTGRARLPAAVSVGTNPTFDGNHRRVEAYVLDAPSDLDLYGEHISVDLVARLRGIQRFDSVEALVRQMSADVDAARAVLAQAPSG